MIIVKEFDNVPSSFGRRTLTNNYTCCFVIKFKEFDDIIREQANRMAIIIATAIYRLPMVGYCMIHIYKDALDQHL